MPTISPTSSCGCPQPRWHTPTTRSTRCSSSEPFPDGIDELRDELIGLYRFTDDERGQQKAAAEAFVSLERLDRQLGDFTNGDSTAVIRTIEDYEKAPVALLQTHRFGIVRHILVARYLHAKAEYLRHTQHDRIESELPIDAPPDESLRRTLPDDLIEAAVVFYHHSWEATRKRGAAGILRNKARESGEELRRICDLPEVGKTDVGVEVLRDRQFEQMVQTIHDLLLIVITGRAGLTDDQLIRLRGLIEPVHSYLTRHRF